MDTSNGAWTQVNSEMFKDFRHSKRQNICRSPLTSGMLPYFQTIHIGTACPNSQRSYQWAEGWSGTYGTDLHLPQSALTCASELVRMHKPGGPGVLLLRGFSTGAAPMIDVQAHAATGICYGIVLSLQGCISGELNAFAPSSRVEGMSSVSGNKPLPF